jgi:transcriptional regulator with XRE-family HTH domain
MAKPEKQPDPSRAPALRVLPQEQLAKKASATQGYIAQLERGLRKNPSLPALRKLAQGSRGINDVEIAVNSSEQRGQLCIVVENSHRATPNEHDHASGKFQHIAVTRPRQISQRKRLPVLAERGLDLSPDVAFAMRHGALERETAEALLPIADNLKRTTRG